MCTEFMRYCIGIMFKKFSTATQTWVWWYTIYCRLHHVPYLFKRGLNLVVYVEVSQVFLELVPCHLHIRDCRLLLEQIPLEHILHPKPSPAFITPCWQAKSIASCSLFHELEHLPKRSRNLTRVHRSMAMFFGPGKVQ